MNNWFSNDSKVQIAKLETKIHFLEALLVSKDTEIRRLNLQMEKKEHFYTQEIASIIRENRPVEGASMDFSDLNEPTEEETTKQVEKAQKEYADYCFWNEGSGIRYEPEGYLKDNENAIS